MLELSIPSIPRNMFNSPEVKKAYRKMAKIYHPDKVAQLPDEEQDGAKKKFQDIVRAYECLTDEVKFNNWIEYGNPEGSMVHKALEVAIPSWFFEQDNQIYVLLAFFILCVAIPMVVIACSNSSDDTNNPVDNEFRESRDDKRTDKKLSKKHR